jgi:hypothetical protein
MSLRFLANYQRVLLVALGWFDDEGCTPAAWRSEKNFLFINH